jgi:hypothetical protein
VNALTVTEPVGEQALELLAEARVVLLRRPGTALVCGRNDAYLVTARTDGVACTCRASRDGRFVCSHSAAAMVKWQEAQP